MRRVLGMIMLVSVVAGRAHAQSGDSSAIAEQLFNQARDLAKANQWPEACSKFEASLRYDPVLGTKLNLATCYEHIGKLTSAWSLYRESSDMANKTGDVKRRAYAQKQAAMLEPRLPKLTIAAPTTLPAGFIVKRDGTKIDAGALGVALYVDPGAHEIVAAAPGFEAFTKAVTLVEGKAETLAIPDLKPVPDTPKPAIDHPVATTAPVVAPSPTRRRITKTEPLVAPSPTRKYIAVGAGAAGVAAVGVGFLFGAKANSTYRDAKALCGADLVCDPPDYDRGKQLIHNARSSATTSTVLVAAGGAAIIAGAVVFLTAPHARERATAQIVPVTHDRGAGLAVVGRF